MNDGHTYQILVVDDLENWRRDLTHMLREEGYNVSAAANFEDALREINKNIFDLIILDVRLKYRKVYDVGGLELLLQIKGLESMPQVIVLTGHPESIPEGFLEEHGVDKLLLKVPKDSLFDVNEFKGTVRDLLRERTIKTGTEKTESKKAVNKHHINITHIPKKILFVENDRKWQNYIGDLLTNVHRSLILVSSFKDAVKRLDEEVFDLIIVNLCLKDNRDYEGISILDYLKMKYKTVPCIVLTGSPLETTGLQERYNIAKLFIKGDINSFKDSEFFIAIEQILKKEQVVTAPDPEYDYTQEEWYSPQWPEMKNETFEKFWKSFHVDVLLMTATECELRQVIRLLKPPSTSTSKMRKIRCIQKDLQTYYVGKFGAFSVVVVKSEMGAGGPGGALNTARDAIQLWNPKALIMVGIVFGADRNKYQPADVLIADKIVPYEKQRKGEKAIFRSEIPRVGLTLLNRFKNVSDWSFKRPDKTEVKCYSGAILSGEKLIDDPILKKELIDQFPEAIGGEMEGAGIYAAAYRAGLEWILVKGVSDWADGNKHKGYQDMAVAAAVSLTHFVLSSPNALDGVITSETSRYL